MHLLVLAALALVSNGKPCVSEIVLPQLASRVEQRAGMELRYWMGKTCGGGPRVVNQPLYGPDKTTFIVTSLPHGERIVPRVVRARLEASESGDAYAIFAQESGIAGPCVFIVGKREIGAYYGVNAFIEDYLGVRFFHPGPAGTYVPPKHTDLSVETGKVDFREPKVPSRKLNTWYGAMKPLDFEKDVLPWQARRTYTFSAFNNREELGDEALTLIAMGNTPATAGGELVLGAAVPTSLFKEHPEYFALVKGERVMGTDKEMRRCLSNPAVRKLVVQYAARHLAMSPSFSLDYRDHSGGWCECAECKKYGSDAAGNYSVPNIAHRFEKDVFDELLRLFPEARFGNLIYLDYRKPITTDLTFDKRINVLYCPHQRCYVHALADKTCRHNRRFSAWFDFWRKRYPGIGFFDYYCYSNMHYAPAEWTLEKDFKDYFARDGFHCWLEDASCGTGADIPYLVCNWQMYYLASKLMWDPTIDAAKLFDESYDLYYGPAAKPMKEYHAFRRKLWETAPLHSYMGSKKRAQYVLGVKGAKEKLLALLNEADKFAAGNADVQRRIKTDRECLTKIWIASFDKAKDSYRMRESVDDPVVAFPDNGDFRIHDKTGFPADFGSNVKKFDGEAVVLSNAVFYGFTDNPTFAKPVKMRLTVVAKGTGKLRLGTRYCLRPPGNDEQVRMDETAVFGEVSMTPKWTTYSKVREVPAWSRHYIFFSGNGPDIRLKSVAVDFDENEIEVK